MAKSDRPQKRAKLLEDSSDDDDDEAGVKLNINEEYAKRFEYNKKREEKQQLEEKYNNVSTSKRKRDGDEDDEDSDEDSEDDESEDDDAQLATEDVDDEIMATLQAIRTKDPKVYDQSVKFFKEFNPEQNGGAEVKKEKPMYLQDYHRENLLAGRTGAEEGTRSHRHTLKSRSS